MALFLLTDMQILRDTFLALYFSPRVTFLRLTSFELRNIKRENIFKSLFCSQTLYFQKHWLLSLKGIKCLGDTFLTPSECHILFERNTHAPTITHTHTHTRSHTHARAHTHTHARTHTHTHVHTHTHTHTRSISIFPSSVSVDRVQKHFVPPKKSYNEQSKKWLFSHFSAFFANLLVYSIDSSGSRSQVLDILQLFTFQTFKC